MTRSSPIPPRGFDPFQDRLCRNVRNELSESIPVSFQSLSMDPSRHVANAFLAKAPPVAVQRYIEDRLARYEYVLSQMQSNEVSATDSYKLSKILWDQALFFEVHEVLEEKWHRSQGDEKKMIQALIRAAGVYVHLEYGRRASAEKMAPKAINGLMAHKDAVAEPFDVETLVRCLGDLTMAPPKLMPH